MHYIFTFTFVSTDMSKTRVLGWVAVLVEVHEHNIAADWQASEPCGQADMSGNAAATEVDRGGRPGETYKYARRSRWGALGWSWVPAL